MEKVSCEEISSLISSRLDETLDSARNYYINSSENVGTRFTFIDELLPEELAREAFLSFDCEKEWRLMNSFREKKLTSKAFDAFNPILKNITFALQSPAVIKRIEGITHTEKYLSDRTLYAGGLSKMERGHFLNPHIDNSHDGARELYRRLNLLYYVSPNWHEDNGGHLELWDKKVHNKVVIPAFFNRLVLMETGPWTWHSVSQVQSDRPRCCISNYYFSKDAPSENKFNYFHVTSFMARPEEKCRRLVCHVDNFLRSGLRKVFPSGLGRKDVYSDTDED